MGRGEHISAEVNCCGQYLFQLAHILEHYINPLLLLQGQALDSSFRYLCVCSLMVLGGDKMLHIMYNTKRVVRHITLYHKVSSDC